MNDIIAECSLAELVEDPLIGLLMKSDGVDRRSVELLFERLAGERVPGVHRARSCRADEEAGLCPA